MRILHLRFQNLNSLVGCWAIDLTHPDFGADGIFAITGPTGAGKSTILDALSLALYGRTPRLPRVNAGGNEIMSRQTGECFAEVTFETQTGRFRCHWSQYRAYRKSDGALQPPKHEMVDARTDEILESSIRGVAERVESVTGMDFDRFTRSMLLAQGGFAAFLQAAPDERAPILEQITGTEIYSRISMAVHERKQHEKEKFHLLQAETAGIAVLTPEQEEELAKELEAKNKEEAELTTKSAKAAASVAWLNTVAGLKKEIISLGAEAAKLQHDMEAFKADREKLARAMNAAGLDGAYATLVAVRKQQSNDRQALQAAQKALPELESSAQKQAEALKSAEQRTAQVKKELQTAAPTLQAVRALDQKLDTRKKAVSESEAECGKDAKTIEADQKALLAAQKKRDAAQETLKDVDAYLKKNAQDEWLVTNLTGVAVELNDLAARRGEIDKLEANLAKSVSALEQAEKLLAKCREQSGLRKKDLEDATKRLKQEKDALTQLLAGRLLREYRTEKDTLVREAAYLAKIEDYRAKLEDGVPCPLCGATTHPFDAGNAPAPDATEQKIAALDKKIARAEELENSIRKLAEAQTSADKNLTEAEKQETAADHAKTAAEKALTETRNTLQKLQNDFVVRKQDITAKILPLGVTYIPEADPSSLLDGLKARLEARQNRINQKTQTEKALADMDGEIRRLHAVIQTRTTALAEKRERLEAMKKELATGITERRALYGDKNPDNEERRLQQDVTGAESAEKKAGAEHNALQQKWNTAKTQAESLNRSISRREPELTELEAQFLKALAPAGFPTETEFLAAVLPVEQRMKLTARAKELDERQTKLEARQKDREERLAAEIARDLTDRSLEELAPMCAEYEKSLKALRDAVAGLRHKMRENIAARERIKEKQAAIAAHKKECAKWENLHGLIGSADGKKYRNFAQGLTFEILVSHANSRLAQMTDRYLLVRDRHQPLELNVVDSYQAGETRSTKNLSGGETFIVSLALALGLSHMAGRNVRVDSLFLDEGFGTLDDEALETALETLAGLRQDGKLIGVISHVTALRERISTQIRVTPHIGGRSRISGPGCSLEDGR